MIIEMGKGQWLFSKATDEQGRHGLSISKADKAYDVGQLDQEKAGKRIMGEDDIFIVIPNLESGVILQEQIIDCLTDILGWDKRQ